MILLMAALFIVIYFWRKEELFTVLGLLLAGAMIWQGLYDVWPTVNQMELTMLPYQWISVAVLVAGFITGAVLYIFFNKPK